MYSAWSLDRGMIVLTKNKMIETNKARLNMWKNLSYSSSAENYEILKLQHLNSSSVMTQD